LTTLAAFLAILMMILFGFAIKSAAPLVFLAPQVVLLILMLSFLIMSLGVGSLKLSTTVFLTAFLPSLTFLVAFLAFLTFLTAFLVSLT